MEYKYQVALDNIWLDINEGVIYSTDLERLMKDLKKLGELVDLATPKKVNEYQDALNRLANIDLNYVLDKFGYEGAEKVSFHGINDYPNLEKQGDIDLLQELIDKAIAEQIEIKNDYEDMFKEFPIVDWSEYD